MNNKSFFDASAKRILLVEDDLASLQFMALALESEDYVVIKATSVREAKRLVSNCSPQVLLTDIGLPGEDVSILANALRRGHNTLTIAVSGYPAIGLDKTLLSAFDKFFLKPIELDNLLEFLKLRLNQGSNTEKVEEERLKLLAEIAFTNNRNSEARKSGVIVEQKQVESLIEELSDTTVLKLFGKSAHTPRL